MFAEESYAAPSPDLVAVPGCETCTPLALARRMACCCGNTTWGIRAGLGMLIHHQNDHMPGVLIVTTGYQVPSGGDHGCGSGADDLGRTRASGPI